jgi:hypothetical protein
MAREEALPLAFTHIVNRSTGDRQNVDRPAK